MIENEKNSSQSDKKSKEGGNFFPHILQRGVVKYTMPLLVWEKKGSSSEEKRSPRRSELVSHGKEKTVVDLHVNYLLDNAMESLGKEGAEKVVEATKRFAKRSNEELRGALSKIPEYVDAAHAANLDPQVTEDLLLHTLNAPKGDYPKSEANLHHLIRGLTYSAAHKESVSTEAVETLKGLITDAAEHNVIVDSLRAYEASRMAGLSLKESVALVKTIKECVDTDQVGLDVSRFATSLKELHLADADPEKVKDIFIEVLQLPEQDRSYAHYDFQDAIEVGLEIGIEPKKYIEEVASKMEWGTAVNDALFGTRLEYEKAAQQQSKTKKEAIRLQKDSERKKELQKRVDEAFENPLVVSYNHEAQQTEKAMEEASVSALSSELPDSSMFHAEVPSEESYRISVSNPDEYSSLLEIVGQKMVEKGFWAPAFADSVRDSNVRREGTHGKIAERATAIRGDTELDTLYSIDIFTDSKAKDSREVRPFISLVGSAPVGVLREIVRGPSDLSAVDKITLGIYPHKNREDTS